MRRRLALLLALPFLVLAACGDDDAGSDGEGSTETTEAEGDTGEGGGDELEVGGNVTVELLDAGQEPRQVLRLQPPADCEQQVTQRQSVEQQTVSASLDGQPVPPEQLEAMSQTTGQTTEYDVTYRCEELGDDRIAVVNRYDDVRLEQEGPGQEQVQELLDGFVGAEGRIVYDAQGRIVDAEAPDVDIDEDVVGEEMATSLEQMLDNLGSTIEQSANPFPDEPVGVGGRWRVTTDIAITGLEARSVTEYTVTSLADDHVEATLTLSMEFVPGEMDFPGMPAGGAAEIVSGSLQGTGTTSWDLDGVVAYFDQALEGAMAMRVSTGGQTVEMSIDQQQRMSLQPR